MLNIGRYYINNDFKVHGIISENNPNGDGIYDPYESKEVLPFWGNLVTTFWGLNDANRKYLIENLTKEELKEFQFKKYWVFWFCNGDFNNQIELFFYDENAKDNSYKILQIFNHLHEVQVDRLLEKSKKEFYENLKL